MQSLFWRQKARAAPAIGYVSRPKFHHGEEKEAIRMSLHDCGIVVISRCGGDSERRGVMAVEHTAAVASRPCASTRREAAGPGTDGR